MVSRPERSSSADMGAVIASSVLPYYAALAPCPADARSAFAVVDVDHRHPKREVGTSIMVEDRGACAEVFRFSNLGATKIAWSPGGRVLAFAQDSTLVQRDESGALHLTRLDDAISWIGSDHAGRLWCLAAGSLGILSDGSVRPVARDVACADVSRVAVCCRHDRPTPTVHLHDGLQLRELPWRPRHGGRPVARLSSCGKLCLVVESSPPTRDVARVSLTMFDLATLDGRCLMEAEVGIGFNGGPAIDAAPLPSGEALVRFEARDAACSRIWSLRPGAAAEPISPDGYEAFDFAIDGSGIRIALVASDSRSAIGASERRLLVGRRHADGWRWNEPRPGVYDMPRWRPDGRLDVVCGQDGRWMRRTVGPDEALALGPPGWSATAAQSPDGTEYDLLRWPLAAARRRAGIILLPRLHQQFTAGPQSFFFHHLLAAIAAGLALDGYDVVALNGPGSIGRGRARRAPDPAAGSYFALLTLAVEDVVRRLRDEGCCSVGLLAGSLAAVPALRLVGSTTQISAAAFVAPVFEATIAVAAPWQYCLLDDPLIRPIDAAASQVCAHLLVIHGVRDEVAPLEQVMQVRDHVPTSWPIELMLLEDEGHIFKRMDSWPRTSRAIADFFARRLTDEMTPGAVLST